MQKDLRPNNKDLVRYKNNVPGRVIGKRLKGKDLLLHIQWKQYPYRGSNKNQKYVEQWVSNKHCEIYKRFKEPNVLVRLLERLINFIKTLKDDNRN